MEKTMKSLRGVSTFVKTAASWTTNRASILDPKITVPVAEGSEKSGRDGLRRLTREEARRYYNQLEVSHGYDMDDFPPVLEAGMIRPMDIHTDPNAKRFSNQFGRFAIEVYNKKMAEGGGGGVMLEFVKPLKINIQLVAGFNFFITFQAKDVGASDHQSRIYQAKVYNGIVDTQVTQLRLKPTATVNSDFMQNPVSTKTKKAIE